MKPLKLEELTLEQKIGQLLMVRGFMDDADRKYIYEMIEKRCVGAVQVACYLEDGDRNIREVKEHADYPILIFADMENGYPKGEHTIPSALALSVAGSEELAYQFGSVTAIEAKQKGYCAVGGPVLDMIDGNKMLSLSRCYGAESDIDYVSRMSNAVLQGENDHGILGVAKHWPSPADIRLDGHVFPDVSAYTKEDLIHKTLAPYVYAMKNGGLDAVMTTHTYLPAVDDTYPTSMSESIIGILRDAGFDGLLMTDSFAMIGILQKFGEKQCYGRAIRAGHDMILPNYRVSFKTAYELLMQAYHDGIFTEERLNEAVSRVIRAQNAAMEKTNTETVSAYQAECFEKIEKDSICVIKDDVPTSLNPTSKKLFVLVKENYYREGTDVPFEISFRGGIADHNIERIKEEIQKAFPGSDTAILSQYPNPAQIESVCIKAMQAEEIVFMTYSATGAYGMGGEFTPQMVHTVEAVQGKLSAVLHIGNPYSLEVLPHSPRYIISVGSGSAKDGLDGHTGTIKTLLSVLGGAYEPKGKLPFELNLK